MRELELNYHHDMNWHCAMASDIGTLTDATVGDKGDGGENRVTANDAKRPSTSSSSRRRKRDPVEADEAGAFPNPSQKRPTPEREIPTDNPLPVLPWRRKRYVDTQSEQRMIPHIMRYGKRERGMMWKQHGKRIDFIEQKCVQNKVELLTALSLRRHYIKKLNPMLKHESLGLGTDVQIREAAEVFERTIQGYLEKYNIRFEDEQLQKKKLNRSNQPMVATPDFWFPEPVSLQVSPTGVTVNIRWLEVKMFYGADTIEPDGKSAVGSILPKSQKYRHLYGPGAIVFLQGCGQQLARALDNMGVMALDPDPDVELEPLWTHMRTWCADLEGNILP
jgi:hypothetical protein